MPVLGTDAPVECASNTCASDTEAATGVDCNTGNTDCVTSAGDGSGSAEVDGEAGCSRSDTDGFRLRGGDGGGGGGGTVSCSSCC